MAAGRNRRFYAAACAACWPYLVIAGDAFVHDVVEVHQEVAVGQHVLVSGHHLADELVRLQLAGFVLGGQHCGLCTTDGEVFFFSEGINA